MSQARLNSEIKPMTSRLVCLGELFEQWSVSGTLYGLDMD
jgi:hypothetical protein